MDVSVDVPRREDEASTQLKRIFAQLLLLEATGFGALAGSSIVLAQQVEQIRFLEFHGSISLALGIDQQRECDPVLFAKLAGVVLVSKSNGGQMDALALELLLVFAQLRDMFAAEDSTIMPQKYDHRRLARPQRPQPELLLICVRQGNLCQAAAERCWHR